MTVSITNRQLLREYKKWKGQLLDGVVHELIIPQPGGKEFRLVVERNLTPFERLKKRLEAKSFPRLKRTKEDLF